MANLNDSAAWPDIYQIETADPVLGGAPNLGLGQGISNVSAQQLAQRTRFLLDILEATGIGHATSGPTPNPADDLNALDVGGIYTAQASTAGVPVAESCRVIHMQSPSHSSQLAISLSGEFYWRTRNNGTGVWVAWSHAVSYSQGGSVNFDVQSAAFRFESDGLAARSTLQWLLADVLNWTVSLQTDGDLNFVRDPGAVNQSSVLRINGSEIWVGENPIFSASNPGRQVFPSGLIMQWGSETVAHNDLITFPVAFPNAAYGITFGDRNTGAVSGQADILGYHTITSSGFNVTAFDGAGAAATSTAMFYMALGR